jgi:hypothetical protein
MGLLEQIYIPQQPVIGFCVKFPGTKFYAEWWRRQWAPWAGLALPFCVIINPHGSARSLSDKEIAKVIKHELRHTDQWLWLGPLFPLVYVILLAIKGYENHPLELDASKHSER